MPSIGYLYPDKYIDLLKCETFDDLTETVKYVPVQKEMLENVEDPNI